VAGPAPIGCDLESVAERADGVWRDLLGPERFSLAERIAMESAEDFNLSATRVWTALECLKKAGGLADAPLVFDVAKTDGWVLLSSGRQAIATYPAQVREVADRLVFGILVNAHHRES
jgi:enediyne polyketide synthase